MEGEKEDEGGVRDPEGGGAEVDHPRKGGRCIGGKKRGCIEGK